MSCFRCYEHIHTCFNCYWGQIDMKENPEACHDCEGINQEIPTEWMPLGDNYCRDCGKKLKSTIGD